MRVYNLNKRMKQTLALHNVYKLVPSLHAMTIFYESFYMYIYFVAYKSLRNDLCVSVFKLNHTVLTMPMQPVIPLGINTMTISLCRSYSFRITSFVTSPAVHSTSTTLLEDTVIAFGGITRPYLSVRQARCACFVNSKVYVLPEHAASKLCGIYICPYGKALP